VVVNGLEINDSIDSQVNFVSKSFAYTSPDGEKKRLGGGNFALDGDGLRNPYISRLVAVPTFWSIPCN
jgi:hypothetical protein